MGHRIELPEVTGWSLIYDAFDPKQQGLREALLTLGNGYFCTRGAAAEASADGVHYPGTYLAGGYNRLRTQIAGRDVENEDLVNFPNWLPLNFRLPDGVWFGLAQHQLLSYRQELDLRKGVLHRQVVFADGAGRRTRLNERRIVHMGDPHLAAIEVTLTAENWSGEVRVASALDGRVKNTGVARYRALGGQHLMPEGSGALDRETLLLQTRTRQSELSVAIAARTRLFQDAEAIHTEREIASERDYIAHVIPISVEQDKPLRVEKVIAIYTSRDFACADSAYAAAQAVNRAAGFDELHVAHARAWSHLWRYFDMELDLREPAAQSDARLVLRLHLFHLLQTVSLHSVDRDTGVPARGWHGEAYRGHVFWDELFVAPFLNLRLPEVSRAMLLYRFRRLPEARAAARAAGYRGAMYPWQSGSDGREESQRVHLNPLSGRWTTDHSRLQRHVGAAVAFNVWQYYEATGDREFLSFYGTEMLVEIARFFSSLARYDPERERYTIEGVVGPDEYHDGYPWAGTPGLRNNTYTNVMAVWVITHALKALAEIDSARRAEIRDTLGLAESELHAMKEVSRLMHIPFIEDGLMAQFEGYERLEELDCRAYKERYGNIQRLDRLLEAEGDDINRYRVSKQADVLMLFYLFSTEALEELFAASGHEFSGSMIPQNIRYYIERTSHGSTLSWIVHSWVLARLDRHGSWALFMDALQSDVADVQGGTTAEGIHLGAMAGSVDLVQRGYTGIELRDGVLWINPTLPDALMRLRMSIRYRGHTLRLDASREQLSIVSEPCYELPIRIGFDGVVRELRAGERFHAKLKH